MDDIKLTEFSSAADVLECVINAHSAATSNDNIYDSTEGHYISIEDAWKVVAQLREAE